MKNSKKIVALVLAMVMIFALTASALAATDSADAVTYTVTVVVRGEANGITTSYARAANMQVTGQVTEQGSKVPTVYDAVVAMAASSAYPDFNNALWKTVPIVDANGNKTGETGQALIYADATWTSYVQVNGSYVLSTLVGALGSSGKTQKIPSGNDTYNCSYTGSDWIFSISHGPNQPLVDGTDYMDRTDLQDGDTVYLTYKTTTESWVEQIED